MTESEYLNKVIKALKNIAENYCSKTFKKKEDLLSIVALIEENKNIECDNIIEILKETLEDIDKTRENILKKDIKDIKTTDYEEIVKNDLDNGLNSIINHHMIWCSIMENVDFILKPFLKTIITIRDINCKPTFYKSRYTELIQAIQNNMPLSFFWLAGSIIEGVLCEYCKKNNIKSNKDDIDGYITALENNNKISKGSTIYTTLQHFRLFRNTIHPNNQNNDFIKDKNLQNRKEELDDVIEYFKIDK